MTQYKICPECKRPIQIELFETATAHQNGSKCRKLLLKAERKAAEQTIAFEAPRRRRYTNADGAELQDLETEPEVVPQVEVSKRKLTRVEGHKIRWFVYAGEERIPYVSTMRGTWGWDAECECGWASKTGGGVYSYVKTRVDEHKHDSLMRQHLSREVY